MNGRKSSTVLLTSEDYWAIWIGAFFLVLGIFFYVIIGHHEIGENIKDNSRDLLSNSQSVPFKTIEWYEQKELSQKLTGSNTPIGKGIKSILTKPKSWVGNPLSSLIGHETVGSKSFVRKQDSLKMALHNAENHAIKAAQDAKNLKYENQDLNAVAESAALTWFQTREALIGHEKKTGSEYNILGSLIVLGLLLSVTFGIGSFFMGEKYLRFVGAFFGVYFLAVLSYILAAQVDMKSLGISYAVWAILIGLIISNTIGTPRWMKPAVQTEYYIKTGLVLLGAEILLGKIMAIGLPGIFVSWVVTPIVLVTTFWFGQKILKIGSKTLNITVSADMSVCGVSAAIATAAACNAKKEELTLAVGLSMIFTSVMMIVMPAFINAVGMPEVLGGAWIGGTIDATGAVVAAGAFLGDRALNVAATIKMIQNVLIGIIAFGVAFYWATKVEKTGTSKVGVGEIWKRFPKFIIGFLGASVVFSIMYALLSPEYSYAFVDHGIIRGFTKDVRGWLFCLAFVSIGLSVNFKELKHQFAGGKPLILYVCGQCFNLLLTLIMAYIMFYIVFPDITEKI